MNKAEKSRVLLVVFLNDNHVSNVRTLQSIFKQSYGNIHIAFCNDATNHFESEKFVNNLRVKRPAGIRSIRLKENRHSIGAYLSFAEAVQAMEAEYITVLRSGEFLIGKEAIEDIVNTFSETDQAGVIALPVREMDDAMNDKILDWDLQTASEDNPAWWKDETIWYKCKDSMFVYRGDLVRQIVKKQVPIQTSIMQTVIPAIAGKGYDIVTEKTPLCMYSKESISNPVFQVPKTLGNDKLLKIRENYISSGGDHETEDKALSDSISMQADLRKKKNWKQVLFRLSRFKKLAIYAVATLLLMICSILLYSIFDKAMTVPFYIFLILTICMSVITMFMLGCNLYFRLFPERLISYE